MDELSGPLFILHVSFVRMSFPILTNSFSQLPALPQPFSSLPLSSWSFSSLCSPAQSLQTSSPPRRAWLWAPRLLRRASPYDLRPALRIRALLPRQAYHWKAKSSHDRNVFSADRRGPVAPDAIGFDAWSARDQRKQLSTKVNRDRRRCWLFLLSRSRWQLPTSRIFQCRARRVCLNSGESPMPD